MGRVIAITGSSGLVGTQLREALRGRGDQVIRLRRGSPKGPRDRQWDPQGETDPKALEGVDAVIHLAGESINQRWTDGARKRIHDSRALGTASIAKAVAAQDKPPALICASAVGYYGADRPEPVREDDAPGSDFLAQVCVDWEAAADPAREAGARVCHMRLGVVLSSAGGALEAMLLPFKLGLGGPIGSGRQPFAWVHLADAADAFLWALDGQHLGAVNVVAPERIDNRTFTETLASALRRPAFMRVPKGPVKLVLGEMGDALLLSGQNVVPGVLEDAGFAFGYPTIKAALNSELA